MALLGTTGRDVTGPLPRFARLRGLIRAAALADARFAVLVLLAGLPLLAGIAALLMPGRILSREMTWDFMFNLAGAWHLRFGHVAHVDFHSAVGELNFLLTRLGFDVVGPRPIAFLFGVIAVAFVQFVLACWVAWRRLPLAPAVLFVAFTSLLVLMPANVGDMPTDFSFAMSYNRYCWSAISILALILFVPPRNERPGEAGDLAAGGILLAAMFYLKVTYFVAGLAALGLALAIFPHVRRCGAAWIAIGGLAIANALAPHSHAYLLDIWGAAQAGGVRTGLARHINSFFANAEGYAPYVAALLVAGVMALRGAAPVRLAVATGFIIATMLALLSQNAQLRGTPLGIVIAFLFYDQLRLQARERRSRPLLTPALLALMIFPLFSIGVSSVSLAAYVAKALGNERLFVVERTQLKGLAVRAEDGALLTAFTSGQVNYRLLNSARHVGARYELSPAEYVETILEAAAVLQDGRHAPGGVVVLDQVNPLPFMLGIEPARGGNLWSGSGELVLTPATIFAQAVHVLIPKFPTYSDATDAQVSVSRAYVAAHFPHREETESWIILSRRGAVRDTGELPPVAPLASQP